MQNAEGADLEKDDQPADGGGSKLARGERRSEVPPARSPYPGPSSSGPQANLVFYLNRTSRALSSTSVRARDSRGEEAARRSPATIRGLLRTMRPQQWVKNLFVLAPVVYAQELFDSGRVLGALAGFTCFCLLASAVYVLNDLMDVEADRAHPVKKHRPIASGAVGEGTAKLALIVLASGALIGGFFLSPLLLAAAAGYLANNVAYSFGLKRVAYLDVLSIAAGFELRVLAGAYAADVPPSAYLLVVTFLLATFLGLGKRMHELVQQERSGSTSSRAVLSRYSKKLVAVLLWITSIATVGAYAVYTLDADTRAHFGTDFLVVTSVFALIGVLRFVHLVRNRPDAESPTEEMLKDSPFLVNGALGALTLIAIIYWS